MRGFSFFFSILTFEILLLYYDYDDFPEASLIYYTFEILLLYFDNEIFILDV